MAEYEKTSHKHGATHFPLKKRRRNAALALITYLRPIFLMGNAWILGIRGPFRRRTAGLIFRKSLVRGELELPRSAALFVSELALGWIDGACEQGPDSLMLRGGRDATIFGEENISCQLQIWYCFVAYLFRPGSPVIRVQRKPSMAS